MNGQLYLEVVKPGSRPMLELAIEGKLYCVGRGIDSDLHLPFIYVGRKCFGLIRHATEVSLLDLGSPTKFLVNRIQPAQKETPLFLDDTVRVGEIILRLALRGFLVEPVWLEWENRQIPRLVREICLRKRDEPRCDALYAILADALEDAGCDNEFLLAHLRTPHPHLSGCSIVEGLLQADQGQ